MVIYIDKTIAEHGEFTEQEETMFTKLACAHKDGNCFLCGHTLSFDRLKKEIPVYRRGIDNNHAEIMPLFSEVETLIVITYGEKPALPEVVETKLNALIAKHDDAEEKVNYVRVISVEQATDYRLNEQSIFLCESTNDCAFYKLLAHRYLHSIRDKIRGVSLSLKDENGGGQMTFQQLEKCVKTEHHLTVCITDSDKKHGTSQMYVNEPGIGKTAGFLKAAETALNDDGLSNLFELHCLDVHEVENLIPFSLLEELKITDANGRDRGITYLRMLQSKKDDLGDKYPEVLLCYDIKKGININDLRKKSEHPQFNKKPLLAYWEEIISIVHDESLPGVANDALVLSIERMKQQDTSGNERILNIALDDHLVDYWNTIGKKVFSWGVAHKPRPTNPSHC